MKKLLSLMLLACLSSTLMAQGTVDDYKRAFAQRAKYSGKVYYDNVQPTWIGNTHSFWYIQNTPDGRNYLLVNSDKQKRSELFNHDKLAKALKDATKRDYRANGLYLDRLMVDEKLSTLHFQANGHRWSYDIRKNQLTDEGAIPQQRQGRQRHWMERDDELEAAPVTIPIGMKI